MLRRLSVTLIILFDVLCNLLPQERASDRGKDELITEDYVES